MEAEKIRKVEGFAKVYGTATSEGYRYFAKYRVKGGTKR
jgi:hypothetical protein